MPETVPGITFDKEGVCNFCRSFEELRYHGKEKLDEIIETQRKKAKDFEAIVPMSGGRDSTYALYLARKVYKLKAIAINYDNEFRTTQALRNIERACRATDTEFISVRSRQDISVKIARSQFREELSIGFIKRPNICRACSYGIKSVPYQFAIEHEIPLILYAGSQEEDVQQMVNYVWSNIKIPLKRKLLGKLLPLNPYHWVARWNIMRMKLEFPVEGNSPISYSIRPKIKDRNIVELHIFHYIPWHRKVITETITKELGWEKMEDHVTSWKNDCKLHQFINYDYINLFGASRDCFGYCRMIMAGKMTREEALRQEEELLDSFEQGIINGVNVKEFLLIDVGLKEKEVDKILNSTLPG